MSIPLIGITTNKTLSPAGLPAVMVLQAYVSAIMQAGGAPILIPSDLSEEGWHELARRLNGILFTGGGDVAIERFAGQPHPKVGGVDVARDEIELGLVRSAAESGTPFLGICRGLQVVNVALGGTLYTDILDQASGAIDHSYESPDRLKERIQLVHPVQIEPESQAQKILAVSSLQVNSLHHQGIKDLAPVLRASAFAPDGIIEAVELPGHPFGVAVQWHPEWLTDQDATQRLFKAFVEAARAR